VNRRERVKLLFGPYRQPRCRLGKKLFCEIRGWVPVRRISAGRIPWPQTIVGRNRAFILCGDLVKAVRRESVLAICHWWAVNPQTVRKWRRAIDVGPSTEGTSRLRSKWAHEILDGEIRERAIEAANSPEANAKKSAARMGKPMHPRAREALAKARPKRLPAEQRRKIGEAHQRLGTRPPKAGRPWSEEEARLLGKLPDAEVAQRTGRTLVAVRCERRRRSIPAYARPGKRPRGPAMQQL
jgi:hypothetical protein